MDMHTDILLPLPTTQPYWMGAPEPLPVPKAGTSFEAPTPFGPLRLSVSAGAARHAADAAIALYRCEALLGALDEWTGLDLDWRWAAALASDGAQPTHAQARWPCRHEVEYQADGGSAESVPGDPACRLALPWAMLRTLSAPAGVLARQLHWPGVAVVLTVSQPRLGVDELAQLEPGGAVVLPESLLPHWLALLRSADEPARAGVPMALPSPWVPRLETSRAHTGSSAGFSVAMPDSSAGEPGSDTVLCEVRLASERALGGDRLAGWSEDALSEAGELGPHASLWRCATDREPAVCLAVGRLMPWGRGWALGLEALCDPERPVGDSKA